MWNRRPELRRQALATAGRRAEQQRALAGRGHHRDRIRLREVGRVEDVSVELQDAASSAAEGQKEARAGVGGRG